MADKEARNFCDLCLKPLELGEQVTSIVIATYDEDWFEDGSFIPILDDEDYFRIFHSECFQKIARVIGQSGVFPIKACASVITRKGRC